MVKVLIVGAGGFLGSVLRYLTVVGVQGYLDRPWWPWGTFVVNMTGCLAIGVVAGLVDVKGLFGPETRVFLMMGLLGGFTTFSAFGYETLGLLRDGRMAAAAANIVLSVIVGVAAAFVGYKTGGLM
ncbi:MAG TPA: fluoride efflux transporter CrcB [Phycisphaerales bacterium]|nr:fluoride efflux transporter CrcB [Phycisphaerales bacterium]